MKNLIRRRHDLVAFTEDGPMAYPFNCHRGNMTRHGDGFEEFEVEPQDCNYNVLWQTLAEDILDQLEAVYGVLDYRNETQICQAYADFFRVHIHLNILMGDGYRARTYIPVDDAPNRHIHMLVDDNHCYPVTGVRSFFARTGGSGKMSVHNFCDWCGYATNDSINAAKMKEHVSGCLTRNRVCRPRGMLEFDKLTNEDHLQVSRHMRKETQQHCLACDCYSAKRKSTCEGHTLEVVSRWICGTCNEPVEDTLLGTGSHVCYIKAGKPKDPLIDTNIWVYDIESKQGYIGAALVGEGGKERDAYAHVPNLFCMTNVYTGERFEEVDVDVFCEFLYTSPKFDDSSILAHNGGGYDHQEVLRFCERRGINYRTTPHPMSQHKFLQLEFSSAAGKPRRLIDFMAFVSNSLKRIGEDFQLPVQKGDFPHNFSREQNQAYVGPIPPLLSEEDYFGYHSKRSVEDQVELKTWHAQEVARLCACDPNTGEKVCSQCGTENWCFQTELRRYCWLDVEVLAQSCKKYRAAIMTEGDSSECGWIYRGRDPFACITQGQVAIGAFLEGFDVPPPLVSSQYNDRPGYNPKSNAWLLDKQTRGYPDLIYRGNRIQEFYIPQLDLFLAGFSPAEKTVFLFYDCTFEDCPHCCAHPREAVHPVRRMKYEDIALKAKKDVSYLERTLKLKVVTVTECMFDHDSQMDDGVRDKCEVIKDREFFYGGRTEVFCPLAVANEEFQIKDFDVTSLYPSVCAGSHGEEMPVGMPTVIHYGGVYQSLPEDLWGFVKCEVVPHPDCQLGLLPSRDPESGRLQFTLLKQVGVWHTCELRLAMSQGYRVTRLFAAYHWAPEDRSKDLMKGYVSYWLRQKQESDGWKKAGCRNENPTEEEKDAAVERMFQANGGIARMRKERVGVNAVMRSIAKIFLNCLWGKFAQEIPKTHFIKLNGQHSFCEFLDNKWVDLESMKIRYLGNNILKIEFALTKGNDTFNPRYNIWIAACVTAFARCVLHGKMLEVGPTRCIYSDTDSLKFFDRREHPHLAQKGLGQWADDYPDDVILRVICLAPKCYYVELEKGGTSVKCKGVSLTQKNQAMMTEELLNSMLLALYTKKKIPEAHLSHMSITSNSQYSRIPYATLLTFYSKKILQPVLTKRDLVYLEEGVTSLEGVCVLRTKPKRDL